VIHRTFRSLDDAPKLVGFTIRQWAVLIGGATVALGVVHVAQLPTKVAITLLVFTVGLPGALAYVSESGGLALGRLLADVCRWRLTCKSLPPASSAAMCSPGVLIEAATPAPVVPDQLLPEIAKAETSAIWERWA
jgi:hypothetical protein